jgi:UDP-N-acetylglucosamine acyltransferase
VKLHSSSVVSDSAQIGRNVQIGPFSVIESDVTIGDDCILEAQTVIKRGVALGPGNHVFEGAVLGGFPQHINVPDQPGRVTIGAGNTIREFVTIHRAFDEEESTVIGENNLLMVGVHVAHDCRIGNHTIFANNVALAGHVTVGDRAYLSGGVGVHQFCRVGRLAMIGGHARVIKDVPPYVTIDGGSGFVVGLNQIGLRRAGHTVEEVNQLKDAYRLIYRSGLSWNEIIAGLANEFGCGLAAHFHQFLSTTTRGITAERRLPPSATIKLRRVPDGEEIRYRARAV